MRIPNAPAWLSPDAMHWVALCPLCNSFHFHGAGGVRAKAGEHLGHRLAYCTGNKPEPGGYNMVRAGTLTTKGYHHLIAAACRINSQRLASIELLAPAGPPKQ